MSATPMWTTGKLPLKKRWKAFVKHRIEHELLVVGSEKMFRERWKMFSDSIHELGAKGHPVCDKCSKYQAIYDKLEGRVDDEAKAARLKADEEHAQHEFEHQGERAYGDDIWDKAEIRPDLLTAHNFDSPICRLRVYTWHC